MKRIACGTIDFRAQGMFTIVGDICFTEGGLKDHDPISYELNVKSEIFSTSANDALTPFLKDIVAIGAYCYKEQLSESGKKGDAVDQYLALSCGGKKNFDVFDNEGKLKIIAKIS